MQTDNHTFEEVKEFKYLRVVISNTNKTNKEEQKINARIKAASEHCIQSASC